MDSNSPTNSTVGSAVYAPSPDLASLATSLRWSSKPPAGGIEAETNALFTTFALDASVPLSLARNVCYEDWLHRDASSALEPWAGSAVVTIAGHGKQFLLHPSGELGQRLSISLVEEVDANGIPVAASPSSASRAAAADAAMLHGLGAASTAAANTGSTSGSNTSVRLTPVASVDAGTRIQQVTVLGVTSMVDHAVEAGSTGASSSSSSLAGAAGAGFALAQPTATRKVTPVITTFLVAARCHSHVAVLQIGIGLPVDHRKEVIEQLLQTSSSSTSSSLLSSGTHTGSGTSSSSSSNPSSTTTAHIGSGMVLTSAGKRSLPPLPLQLGVQVVDVVRFPAGERPCDCMWRISAHGRPKHLRNLRQHMSAPAPVSADAQLTMVSAVDLVIISELGKLYRLHLACARPQPASEIPLPAGGAVSGAPASTSSQVDECADSEVANRHLHAQRPAWNWCFPAVFTTSAIEPCVDLGAAASRAPSDASSSFLPAAFPHVAASQRNRIIPGTHPHTFEAGVTRLLGLPSTRLLGMNIRANHEAAAVELQHAVRMDTSNLLIDTAAVHHKLWRCGTLAPMAQHTTNLGRDDAEDSVSADDAGAASVSFRWASCACDRTWAANCNTVWVVTDSAGCPVHELHSTHATGTQLRSRRPLGHSHQTGQSSSTPPAASANASNTTTTVLFDVRNHPPPPSWCERFGGCNGDDYAERNTHRLDKIFAVASVGDTSTASEEATNDAAGSSGIGRGSGLGVGLSTINGHGSSDDEGLGLARQAWSSRFLVVATRSRLILLDTSAAAPAADVAQESSASASSLTPPPPLVEVEHPFSNFPPTLLSVHAVPASHSSTPSVSSRVAADVLELQVIATSAASCRTFTATFQILAQPLDPSISLDLMTARQQYSRAVAARVLASEDVVIVDDDVDVPKPAPIAITSSSSADTADPVIKRTSARTAAGAVKRKGKLGRKGKKRNAFADDDSDTGAGGASGAAASSSASAASSSVAQSSAHSSHRQSPLPPQSAAHPQGDDEEGTDDDDDDGDAALDAAVAAAVARAAASAGAAVAASSPSRTAATSAGTGSTVVEELDLDDDDGAVEGNNGATLDTDADFTSTDGDARRAVDDSAVAATTPRTAASSVASLEASIDRAAAAIAAARTSITAHYQSTSLVARVLVTPLLLPGPPPTLPQNTRYSGMLLFPLLGSSGGGVGVGAGARASSSSAGSGACVSATEYLVLYPVACGGIASLRLTARKDNRLPEASIGCRGRRSSPITWCFVPPPSSSSSSSSSASALASSDTGAGTDSTVDARRLAAVQKALHRSKVLLHPLHSLSDGAGLGSSSQAYSAITPVPMHVQPPTLAINLTSFSASTIVDNATAPGLGRAAASATARGSSELAPPPSLLHESSAEDGAADGGAAGAETAQSATLADAAAAPVFREDGTLMVCDDDDDDDTASVGGLDGPMRGPISASLRSQRAPTMQLPSSASSSSTSSSAPSSSFSSSPVLSVTIPESGYVPTPASRSQPPKGVPRHLWWAPPVQTSIPVSVHASLLQDAVAAAADAASFDHGRDFADDADTADGNPTAASTAGISFKSLPAAASTATSITAAAASMDVDVPAASITRDFTPHPLSTTAYANTSVLRRVKVMERSVNALAALTFKHVLHRAKALIEYRNPVGASGDRQGVHRMLGITADDVDDAVLLGSGSDSGASTGAANGHPSSSSSSSSSLSPAPPPPPPFTHAYTDTGLVDGLDPSLLLQAMGRWPGSDGMDTADDDEAEEVHTAAGGADGADGNAADGAGDAPKSKKRKSSQLHLPAVTAKYWRQAAAPLGRALLGYDHCPYPGSDQAGDGEEQALSASRASDGLHRQRDHAAKLAVVMLQARVDASLPFPDALKAIHVTLPAASAVGDISSSGAAVGVAADALEPGSSPALAGPTATLQSPLADFVGQAARTAPVTVTAAAAGASSSSSVSSSSLIPDAGAAASGAAASGAAALGAAASGALPSTVPNNNTRPLLILPSTTLHPSSSTSVTPLNGHNYDQDAGTAGIVPCHWDFSSVIRSGASLEWSPSSDLSHCETGRTTQGGLGLHAPPVSFLRQREVMRSGIGERRVAEPHGLAARAKYRSIDYSALDEHHAAFQALAQEMIDCGGNVEVNEDDGGDDSGDERKRKKQKRKHGAGGAGADIESDSSDIESGSSSDSSSSNDDDDGSDDTDEEEEEEDEDAMGGIRPWQSPEKAKQSRSSPAGRLAGPASVTTGAGTGLTSSSSTAPSSSAAAAAVQTALDDKQHCVHARLMLRRLVHMQKQQKHGAAPVWATSISSSSSGRASSAKPDSGDTDAGAASQSVTGSLQLQHSVLQAALRILGAGGPQTLQQLTRALKLRIALTSAAAATAGEETGASATASSTSASSAVPIDPNVITVQSVAASLSTMPSVHSIRLDADVMVGGGGRIDAGSSRDNNHVSRSNSAMQGPPHTYLHVPGDAFETQLHTAGSTLAAAASSTLGGDDDDDESGGGMRTAATSSALVASSSAASASLNKVKPRKGTSMAAAMSSGASMTATGVPSSTARAVLSDRFTAAAAVAMAAAAAATTAAAGAGIRVVAPTAAASSAAAAAAGVSGPSHQAPPPTSALPLSSASHLRPQFHLRLARCTCHLPLDQGGSAVPCSNIGCLLPHCLVYSTVPGLGLPPVPATASGTGIGAAAGGIGAGAALGGRRRKVDRRLFYGGQGELQVRIVAQASSSSSSTSAASAATSASASAVRMPRYRFRFGLPPLHPEVVAGRAAAGSMFTSSNKFVPRGVSRAAAAGADDNDDEEDAAGGLASKQKAAQDKYARWKAGPAVTGAVDPGLIENNNNSDADSSAEVRVRRPFVQGIWDPKPIEAKFGPDPEVIVIDDDFELSSSDDEDGDAGTIQGGRGGAGAGVGGKRPRAPGSSPSAAAASGSGAGSSSPLSSPYVSRIRSTITPWSSLPVEPIDYDGGGGDDDNGFGLSQLLGLTGSQGYGAGAGSSSSLSSTAAAAGAGSGAGRGPGKALVPPTGLGGSHAAASSSSASAAASAGTGGTKRRRQGGDDHLEPRRGNTFDGSHHPSAINMHSITHNPSGIGVNQPPVSTLLYMHGHLTTAELHTPSVVNEIEVTTSWENAAAVVCTLCKNQKGAASRHDIARRGGFHGPLLCHPVQHVDGGLIARLGRSWEERCKREGLITTATTTTIGAVDGSNYNTGDGGGGGGGAGSSGGGIDGDRPGTGVTSQAGNTNGAYDGGADGDDGEDEDEDGNGYGAMFSNHMRPFGALAALYKHSSSSSSSSKFTAAASGAAASSSSSLTASSAPATTTAAGVVLPASSALDVGDDGMGGTDMDLETLLAQPLPAIDTISVSTGTGQQHPNPNQNQLSKLVSRLLMPPPPAPASSHAAAGGGASSGAGASASGRSRAAAGVKPILKAKPASSSRPTSTSGKHAQGKPGRGR